MTDRELMQQALEALESLKTYAETTEPGLNVGVPAITALRDRLARPEQEPNYWLGYGLQAHTEKPFEGATPLYTAPATYTCGVCGVSMQMEQPEPDGLSWLKKDSNYFSQPKRKPLTDEEIRHFWREATMKPKYTSEFVKDFARAIEAAHGIKGEA